MLYSLLKFEMVPLHPVMVASVFSDFVGAALFLIPHDFMLFRRRLKNKLH